VSDRGKQFTPLIKHQNSQVVSDRGKQFTPLIRHQSSPGFL
jgi:hypothetical protein